MAIFLYILIFVTSALLLFWASTFLIDALVRIARFLGWREFVVAFFIMGIAGTIPNLSIGITSAIHKIPQLSFGDVVGGNVVDLTITVALAALIAKGLPAGGKLIQSSSLFTIAIAILPILLIHDKVLGRGDGIILIGTFFLYIFWVFSKKERFSKSYNGKKIVPFKGIRSSFKDIGKILLGLSILLLGAEGIVRSANFFAGSFDLSLPVIGILIIGLVNCFPEIYFTVISARKGQTFMILGDLMGAVIAPATLVLGIVALICPIEITDFSPFTIARFFLIISALFFFFFVKTDRKITRKEAIFLLFIYVAFVAAEIIRQALK